jgi:DHA1 family tetracycline resistance protein-like MFS transporter
MAEKRNASITFIFITLLLDTLGMGVVIPVLPDLIGSFVDRDMAAASRYYGAFVSVYAAMQFLCAPILGGLSDRFGRRPVILGSLLGAACNYLVSALAPNLAWFFLGRVLAGGTGASFSAANAYIADVTPPAKRAQSFGLLGAAFGLGFILGPLLGGLLGDVHNHYPTLVSSELSLRLPFFAAAGLNLLNCLYGLLVLPESLGRESRRPFTLRRANPLASFSGLWRHPIVIGLSGTMICGFMAQQILQSIWALHGRQRFDWKPSDIGASLMVVGLSSALVQGGLVRAVMPWLRERRALVVGLLFSAAGFTALGLASRGWMVYAIMGPFAIGGLAGPAVQSLISGEVGASEQGELQGSLTSVQSLTAIAGPLLATSLFSRFSPITADPRVPGAPFFAAACFQVCGLLLALRLFARMPARAAAPTE